MREDDFKKFAAAVVKEFKKTADRAVAFLYFRERKNNIIGNTIDEITADFSSAGLSKPRPKILREIFRKDQRVIKFEGNKRRLNSDKIDDVEWQFDKFLHKKKASTPEVANTAPFNFDKFFGDSVFVSKERIFVSKERIKELEAIKSDSFDLTRLVKMCNEINDNFLKENFISVIILVRTVMNHVSPIFKFETFSEVTNNYKCEKSLKGSLQHLEDSSRNIADGYLHIPARKKEILPTSTQVNFSQDLDILLGEIVRILKP